MLNLLLCLAPLAPLQGEWTALPLPSLCDERSAAAGFPALLDGQHLRLEEGFLERRGGIEALLQPTEVGGLLQSLSGGRAELNIFPYAPPLLASGGAADLAWARAALAGLDRAGQRNTLQVDAFLLPGGLPTGGARDLAAAVAGAGAEARHWTARVTPGQEVAFGLRQQERFIADYDVEVSTDSGVAAPLTGSIFSGKTLHLVASRVEGGRRAHVRGLLDLAELERVEPFDPDTPDLGELHEPVLHSVSLAFSGVCAADEYLRVELRGAPLTEPSWTLLLRVASEPEPETLAENDWRALDVSLLTTRGRTLPAFDPGAGLEDQLALEALGPLTAPLSGAGIVSAVETRGRSSRSSAGAGGPPLHVAEGLILIPSAHEAAEGAARVPAFVAAMEAPRLETAMVELARAGFRARFPVAAGEAARLTVGSERTLLVGYQFAIAPNTWMPAPIVEPCFDGLAWQGRLGAGKLSGTAWISETSSIAVRTREDAQLGALQLPSRNLRGGPFRVLLAAAPEVLFSAGPAVAGLTLSLERP